MSTTLVPSIEDVSLKLAAYPYSLAFAFLAVVCLTTRIYTGLRANSEAESNSSPRKIGIVPYWIPWLGHTFQFGTKFQTFIAQARAGAPSDCFAIVLGGGKHNVVTQPSMVSSILALRTETSAKEFTYYTMEKVWNDHKTIRNMNQEALWGPIHKCLYQLSREPFVSKAVGVTVKAVEVKTHSVVSFNSSWVDQSLWERSSNIVMQPGEDSVAEVSLFPLIRDYVADIACRVLMGNAFMDNNPELLQDLWDTDDQFNLFLAGVPGWFPGMTKAARARERVIQAVAEHHEAMYLLLDGKDPGSKWDDMSDVSNVIVDRCKTFKAANAPRRAAACGDAVILWVTNINANQVTFWLLWHVYSDPELLKAIREEIAPYCKIEQSRSDLPIKPPPALSIDINSLMKKCPLLNGTFLETMRMDSLSASVKQVVEDITITESVEDAMIQGHKEPQTYQIPKGETLWLPHAAHQRDGRYWKEPEKFDARRFWVVDEKDPEKIEIDYGTMKVWGGGATICKGRKFAEMEVVTFASAIIAMWEMEPVGGKWVHPGHTTGGGTAKPKKDVRVKMRRRF